MAEFKLGRIRFVWKDQWNNGIQYYKDDVVRFGGKIYICVIGHTSSTDFYTDLDNLQTRWNTLADGQSWKGDWTTATPYVVNDIVKYGGLLYIANAPHTSAPTLGQGLEANSSDWDLFAEGIAWRSDWATSVRYRKNDLVRYGGYTYICLTHHTSAATAELGLEANQSDWTTFNPGIEYEGEWTASIRYKINDVVKYGSGLYICVQHHTSTGSFSADQANWNQFVKGIEFENEWNISTDYQPGDIVRYGGNQYISKTSHVGAIPSSSTANWDLFTEGFNFVDAWSPATSYRIGDVARLNGYTYLASADNLNSEPPSANWSLLTPGIEWKGEWQDDFEYKLGDAVRFGSNAYICVLGHLSEGDDGSTQVPQVSGAANSRPDQDITGTYWNIISVGSETSVLTEDGDLVFFSGSGPARLPIGVEGQLLVAGEQFPEWRSLGETDFNYYVSTEGVDQPVPVRGLTIDKPFKTIRYACEQVLAGPRNPNAKYLLELNRAFIQREVTAWIRYQIDQNTNVSPDAGSIWYNFVYEDFKCERDVGFIVDRLISDLGTGGNVKIRDAALSLLNALEEDENNGTGLYGDLSSERAQSVAAYGYMLELIEDVLANQPPAQIYQNSTDDSTTIITQYIDVAYDAESDALPTITQLVSIITTAIDSNDLATIPVKLAPNNLVIVKTGRHREVLPIIVPAGTCVQGDELRSTNAGPAGSLVDISDSYYTVSTFDRVDEIVSDVVVGSAIIKTAGNDENQITDLPLGDAAEALAVSDLVQVMKQRVDFKLNTMHTASLTDPTGYAAGFNNARKLIKENKKFLQEEVIAFLEENYTSLEFTGSISNGSGTAGTVLTVTDVAVGTLAVGVKIRGTGVTADTTIVSQVSGTPGGVGVYSVDISQLVPSRTIKGFTKFGRTLTRRDIGYIIDALVYDLTYGGNAQSVTAGLAYFGDGNYSVAQIPASIKSATLAAQVFLKDLMSDVAQNITITPLQSAIPQFRDTAGSGAAATVIDDNIDDIIEIVTTGPTAVGTTVTLVDPTPTDGVNTTTALINSFNQLNSQISTIAAAAISYINSNFPTLLYNTVQVQSNAETVLKAVGYDFMFNSNYQTLKAAHAYLRPSAQNLFANRTLKTAVRESLEFVRTQAVANVLGDATAIARIDQLMKIVDITIFGGSNDGSVNQTQERNRDYASIALERNRDFILEEIRAYVAYTYTGTVTASDTTTDIFTISDTSWLKRNVAIVFTGTVFGGVVASETYYVQNVVSATTFTIAAERFATTALNLTTVASGSMTVTLDYDTAACLRDVATYIDALKYDLKFPGNYKSRYVSRYYVNAVLGSVEEDMFYLRDATGLRNMTLADLQGDLTPENEYGTSRTTAGAYASLDPGFGPEDYTTWILNRSPYVQGVTTFGRAAIGQKIDGALHNGGNDSIVSNDFTQVISDGIGAWVANNGRAELVSVFSYYAHIGYLSTEGGRIRGTNGNNSYGDFGSVAEGFDDREIPNSAIVDNKFQFKATVDSVFSGDTTLQAFQFENAGIDYTRAEWSFTGGGTGAIAVQDEFRDGGVFQVRMLENAVTGFDGEFGGRGYVTNANTAQSGTLTSIQLSATDGQVSSAYPGMKIVITGGAGAGQYAIVAAGGYNAGTKQASVVREIDGVAGWEHLVPGTTIVAPNASSTYVVEPAVQFTPPPFIATEETLSSTGTWNNLIYGNTADVYTALTGTYSAIGSSATGAEFTVIRNGYKYIVVVADAGVNYTRLETITIAGTSLGGTTPQNDLVLTITSTNSITGAIQAFDQEGFGANGLFVAVKNSTDKAAYSSDGTTWAEGDLPSTGNWSAVAHGLIDDTFRYKIGTETASTALVIGRSYKIVTAGDTVWTDVGAANGNVGTVFVATATAAGTGIAGETNDTPLLSGQLESVFVAVRSGSTAAAYSNDGITWIATTLPASADWVSVVYGDNKFIAIASDSTTVAISNTGHGWRTATALPNTGYVDITYGKGMFAAIRTASNTVSTTADGVAWSNVSTLPTSAWTSITWGQGVFVAVASDTNTGVLSNDGASWQTIDLGSVDSSVSGYQQVSYGQGVFMATAYLAGVDEYSWVNTSEDGIYWEPKGLPSPVGGFSGYKAIAFGNPQRSGHWLALPFASSNYLTKITTGATAKARALVSDTKIFQVNIIEPGSGYQTPPTVTFVDSNVIFDAPQVARIGDGVLANPTFINRGTSFVTAGTFFVSSDGFADNFQPGGFVAVRRITDVPIPGSNITFAAIPNKTFKLVSVLTLLGEFPGSFTAFFQVSPPLTISEAPSASTSVDLTTRLLYSQVRLTGHDFLDIGTGNFEKTNYPGTPEEDPIPGNETIENNGGRVFFTSTDQDGNFRVGDLFAVEQSTGIATLNADAFNIAGLQELALGNVTLGGGSATITEFSTDPFFTQDSDNVVPTQRAIKAYIANQIGGGQASINVNNVTAGDILLISNQITTVSGSPIRMNATFEFRAGVTGLPIAFNYFLI